MKNRILLIICIILLLIYFGIRFNNIIKLQRTLSNQTLNILKLLEISIKDSSIIFDADSIYTSTKFQTQGYGIKKINKTVVVYSYGFDKDDDDAKITYNYDTINFLHKLYINGDIIIGVFGFDQLKDHFKKLKIKTKFFFNGNIVEISDSIERNIVRQRFLILNKIGSEYPIYNDTSQLLNIEVNWISLLINKDTFYVIQEKSKFISNHNYKLLKALVELYNPIISDKQNMVDSIVTHIGIKTIHH